jgi:hypothetical protein
MQPRTNRTFTPNFQEFESFDFERMCKDLLEREPGVNTADVYGTRGQSDRGVDALAHLEDDEHIDLGQCKRYETYSAADLKRAVGEFLKHWSFWKPVWMKLGS